MRALSVVFVCLAGHGAQACRNELPSQVDPTHASSGAPAVPSGAGASAGFELTILTYNVNYGVAGDPGVIANIAAADADVVLLQETNEAWEAAIVAAVGARYPFVRFHAPVRLAPEGMGVLSRFALESDELLPSPVGWFPAERVVVRTPAGPLQIVNTHLRPAVSESGNWVVGFFTTGPLREREVRAHLPRLDASLPTLWAGDFNEDDDGAATSALWDDGYRAALAAAEPGAVTWHWPGVPLELRLDDVLYQARAFESLGAEVLKGGASDHFAVRVRLRMAPASR